MCVSVVGVCVFAGARVQSWVRVGAVSVAAPQRAEDHGATGHRAAVFDLQVDGVVVDLQGSCIRRKKRGFLVKLVATVEEPQDTRSTEEPELNLAAL